MPILPHTRRPAEPGTVTPSASVAAVQAVQVSRAWPVSMAVVVLMVFTMFWAQTTLLVALVAAVATATVGGFLLTLMFGTGWIIPRRRRVPILPRYR